MDRDHQFESSGGTPSSPGASSFESCGSEVLRLGARQVMGTPHFTSVAPRYDELWGFTYEPIAEFIVQYLQLEPDDHLADVGGGTGAVSHLVWMKAGLKAPVLCVEPSAEMLLEAEKLEGVKPFHGSADDFFSSDLPPNYNKIAVCQSVHLFPDPLGTFRKAAQCLPANATMVIMTRDNETSLPLWKSMKENYHPGYDALKPNLQEAGFNVQILSDKYTAEMTKGELYNKFRRRVFSTMHDQSDEEIEGGLKELDRDQFPGQKNSDPVKVVDTVLVYIATKC